MAVHHRLGVVAGEVPQAFKQYAGRLSIPYVVADSITNVRFRCVHEHGCKDFGHSKYEGLSGVELGFYNNEAFHRPETFIAVCEGEIDTVIMHSMCDVPAVGIGGANDWKRHYPSVLEDYETVYAVGDGDKPGRDMVNRVLADLNNVVPVYMDDGLDVNDVFLHEGAEGVRRRLGL